MILKFALAFIFFAGSVSAKLQVQITQGNVEPITLALVDFQGGTPEEEKLGKQITDVIENDLASTRLFKFIPKNAFIERSIHINHPPQFSNWRVLRTQAVINGSIEKIGTNKVRVRFRLWDIYSEEAMIQASLETNITFWRRTAHLISDAIYKRLTGEEGYFDTRIVYVTEEGNAKRQKKRLAIMDQDGANHKYITDGRNLVLTPRFSPNLQKITYLSFEQKVPKVFVRDLETGRQEMVGRFPGMTFAPRFSPDGNKIIMSQAMQGRSSIFVMDLTTRMIKQITKSPLIDTSPCFDPTGQFITFTSDRGGSGHIYTMNADGSNIKRISFGKGTYTTPVWSPRGDYIAFTKQAGGFYIGVMKPDGSGERLITQGFLVEGPTWAPNGRTLMYTRQEPSPKGKRGVSRLYAIDITGDHERQIKTPQDASDPAWSPALPTA